MGAYLSRPIFEPESLSGSGQGLSFGASSVQGWRTSQEDAHNCMIDFDEDCSLFAVYDGHGGGEVAKYCSHHLPAHLLRLSSYKAGDFKQALIDVFLEIDRTLTEPTAIEVLKQFAQIDSADEGDEEEVREETDWLKKEATMPLEEILNIYQKARDLMRKKEKETNGTDDKDAEDSKQEDSAEITHDDSSEAVAVVPEKKSQGDQKQKPEVKEADQGEEKNGVADKTTEKPEEKLKPCAAGSSSEDVAPSASQAEKPEQNSPGGRGGRAAAQRARRIITDEENNNNNDGDDDDESESSSEEDSDDQDPDDDDDEDEEEDGEESSEEEDDDDDEGQNSDGIEVFDSDVPGSGSGSTAVVALIKGNLLTVANAGDSRAVLCRKGKAIDMSIDHKPEDAAERMRIERAGGKITADGRVNRGLNLSRAIGDHAYKQNKQLPLQEQMISPLPDVQSIVIDRQTDDFVILACDGIWNCMTSQEVCDFVSACYRQGDKLTDICEQLFRRCIAPDTSGDGTGCDNMTCIIVRLSEDQPSGEKRASEEGSEQQAKKSRSEGTAADAVDSSSSSNNQ